MSAQNGKYSPASKFKVVLEFLRAEGRGVEEEVARPRTSGVRRILRTG